MARILLIDDDVDLATELQEFLTSTGHRVTHLERAERGPDLLAQQEFDLVLLDNRMPGMSGLEFLAALRQRDIRIPVIMMTVYASADSGIEAGNLKVFDYLEKPDSFQKLCEQLTPVIARALEIDWRPRQVVPASGNAEPEGGARSRMTGKSKPMLEMYGQIGRVADSDAPVLIRGESGTGKALVARDLHDHSPRQGGPFVVVHCPSLSAELLESELFGHVRGAFTGAVRDTTGKVAAAEGGTLLLDEVGDLPPALQPKLLRLLQERSYERVGETETRTADVRILAATNHDLEAAMRDRTFREDLFYRLNGVTIRLPALRERGAADLRLLANHFLETEAKARGQCAPTLHPDAWARLEAHSWSGNIRELRYVIHRAMILCRGSQILSSDLQLHGEPTAPPRLADEEAAREGLRQAIRWAWTTGGDNLWTSLRDLLEKELLKFASAELEGNKTEIARRLGVNRGTVIKRLQDLDLE
jgi:DNA-binding NtrC family response regulator